MTQPIPCSLIPTLTKKIKPEQLTQIIDAILDGKYSVCVVLASGSESSLHYIPYRTYNRLVKKKSRWQLSRHETSEEQMATNSLKRLMEVPNHQSCLS